MRSRRWSRSLPAAADRPVRSSDRPQKLRQLRSVGAAVGLLALLVAAEVESDEPEGDEEHGDVLDGVGQREISPEVTADAAGVDVPEGR